jgi:hypothetical protein
MPGTTVDSKQVSESVDIGAMDMAAKTTKAAPKTAKKTTTKAEKPKASPKAKAGAKKK